MDKSNNNKEKNSHTEEINRKGEITRKEAIKKTGIYAAVTAASMLIVLSPKKSQAQSPAPNPGWGY